AERSGHRGAFKPLVDVPVKRSAVRRTMASLLTRALLVLVCGFAALSSSAAVALGLAEERVLVFTGLLLALLALPLLARPAFARPSGPALLLALLLAGIVVTDVGGTFD